MSHLHVRWRGFLVEIHLYKEWAPLSVGLQSEEAVGSTWCAPLFIPPVFRHAPSISKHIVPYIKWNYGTGHKPGECVGWRPAHRQVPSPFVPKWIHCNHSLRPTVACNSCWKSLVTRSFCRGKTSRAPRYPHSRD